MKLIDPPTPYSESFWKYILAGTKRQSCSEIDADICVISTSSYGEMTFERDDNMNWPQSRERLKSMLNAAFRVGQWYQAEITRQVLGVPRK
jgi:hypothetical protein